VDYSDFVNRTRNSVFRKFVRLLFLHRDFPYAALLGDVEWSFYFGALGFHVFNAHLYACKRCT